MDPLKRFAAVAIDGKWLHVMIPYNYDIIEEFKKRFPKQYKYHTECKVWSILSDNSYAVFELLAEHFSVVSITNGKSNLFPEHTQIAVSAKEFSDLKDKLNSANIEITKLRTKINTVRTRADAFDLPSSSERKDVLGIADTSESLDDED